MAKDNQNEYLIDARGNPRNDYTLRILKLLFEPPFPKPKEGFEAGDISVVLAIPNAQVRSILEKLTHQGFVKENPSQAEYYQYDIHCPVLI